MLPASQPASTGEPPAGSEVSGPLRPFHQYTTLYRCVRTAAHAPRSPPPSSHTTNSLLPTQAATTLITLAALLTMGSSLPKLSPFTAFPYPYIDQLSNLFDRCGDGAALPAPERLLGDLLLQPRCLGRPLCLERTIVGGATQICCSGRRRLRDVGCPLRRTHLGGARRRLAHAPSVRARQPSLRRRSNSAWVAMISFGSSDPETGHVSNTYRLPTGNGHVALRNRPNSQPASEASLPNPQPAYGHVPTS